MPGMDYTFATTKFPDGTAVAAFSLESRHSVAAVAQGGQIAFSGLRPLERYVARGWVNGKVTDDLFTVPDIAETRLDAGAVSALAVASPVLEDDFERPNQSGLGTTPTGQTWAVTGAGSATAAIENGRFTSDGTTYAYLTLPAQPLQVSGKFSYAAGPGPTSLNAALIMSSDASPTLQNMLHLLLGPTSARITWWKPGLIDQDMASGHTSYTFTTPLATDGTVHEVKMTVVGDTVRIEFSNGEVMESSDPNISDVAGPLCIWEILSNSTTALFRTRWESVKALERTTARVEPPLEVPGGVNGPVGNVTPGKVLATYFGGNTPTPAYPLDINQLIGSHGARIGATGRQASLLIEALSSGFDARMVFKTLTGASEPEIKSVSGSGGLYFRTGTTLVDRITIPQSGGGVLLSEYLQVKYQSSAPATPSAGFARIYPNSVGVWAVKAPDGVVAPIRIGHRTAPAAGAFPYTILVTDGGIVAVTDTSVARALTLPAANAVPAGWEVLVKDESGAAGTSNITINRAGTDTIEGATSKVISTNYGSSRLYSDGTSKWFAA